MAANTLAPEGHVTWSECEDSLIFDWLTYPHRLSNQTRGASKPHFRFIITWLNVVQLESALFWKKPLHVSGTQVYFSLQNFCLSLLALIFSSRLSHFCLSLLALVGAPHPMCSQVMLLLRACQSRVSLSQLLYFSAIWPNLELTPTRGPSHVFYFSGCATPACFKVAEIVGRFLLGFLPALLSGSVLSKRFCTTGITWYPGVKGLLAVFLCLTEFPLIFIGGNTGNFTFVLQFTWKNSAVKRSLFHVFHFFKQHFKVFCRIVKRLFAFLFHPWTCFHWHNLFPFPCE